MGLLNSHQILSGARRPGTIKTYVTSLIKERPTPTVDAAGTVTLDGGVVEFDGRDWSLDGLVLNLDTSAAYLKSNTEYVIAVVPKYDEPLSRTDAETNVAFTGKGINYYIEQDSLTKEFYAKYFLPSAVEASVLPYGGWTALQLKAFKQGLIPAEKLVFDNFSEELNKLSDPRFTGKLMPITGVEFIVVETYPQDNSSSPDKTLQMTQADFEYFLSAQGMVPSKRLAPTAPYTITDAVAGTGTFYTTTTGGGLPIAPGSKLYRLSSIALYSSAANAATNTNPFPVGSPTREDLIEAFNFVTEPSPDGLGWTNVFAAAYEYYMPSYMSQGHTAYEDGVVQFITKEQVRSLGRINPVYLEQLMGPLRTSIKKNARPALMWYADPAAIIKVRTGVCTPTNVDLDDTFNTLGFEVVRDDEIGGR